MAGWTWISVTPGCNAAIASKTRAELPGAPVVVEMVREDHAFVGGELPEREAGPFSGDRGGQANRQSVLVGQFEIDVEEFRAQRDGGEVRRKVGDVDAPRHRTFDLGSKFAQDFGVVGVLPEILERARKSTFTGQK